MSARGLVKRAIAVAAAVACVIVAVVALGFALYAALTMVLVPAAAAAVTALVAALGAALAGWLAAGKPGLGDEEPEEPAGLGQRAFELFRQRPILGTAAALAGGWIFLRNPALATMVAAAFTEKSHGRRR